MAKEYFLLKLPISEIIRQDFSVTADETAEEENGYIIRQGDSLLFDIIEQMRGKPAKRIDEIILVTAKYSPKKEDHLRKLLNDGFMYGGKKYLRFGRSASQGKAGVTAFVCEEIFDKLFEATQMGVSVDNCVISKYEAQRSLVFSTCSVVDGYMPNIVIIGEYEKILPNIETAYAGEEEKTFIIPETGEEIRYKERSIKKGLKDIKLSPFDGCGCHEMDFTQKISRAIGLDYDAYGAQVRMPFVKGYSVYVPFRKILKKMGCTRITDIYGKTHDIDTIDCIWNISMFKGHKLFSEKYGNKAWERYGNALCKYGFKLGISKYSHKTDKAEKYTRVNFQYLQCLDLWNEKYIKAFEEKKLSSYNILSPDNEGKIISLAKYTTQLYEKIIQGNRFYTFKFMGLGIHEENCSESTYIKAVLTNREMLKDPAVKRYIYRKLVKRIQDAKTGKIYIYGRYYTGIGDMIGYLEYAAGRSVKGCLSAEEIYCGGFEEENITSFRSPLVDPSEVNRLKVNKHSEYLKYFAHFEDQDIVMYNMYDISMPLQGGADFDGDIFFLTNNPAIFESKTEKLPVIDIEDKICARINEYNKENITEYEISARDSRIGELTNIATSIENRYSPSPEKRRQYSDQASLLRLYQGKEIDFLKTGVRWHLTSALKKHSKQIPYFLLYNYPKKMKAYKTTCEKNKTAAEKKPLGAYHSPSPMNELCEYICAWEKNMLYDKAFYDIKDTKHLITNPNISVSDKAIYRIVRRYVNKYADELKLRLSSDNKAERQCDAKQEIAKLTAIIEEQTKCRLNEEITANYAIEVCYRNPTASKAFAWNCCGEYILKNLSENSLPKDRLIITDTQKDDPFAFEFLGRYYRIEEN